MVLNFHNHILTNLTHWVAKISWLGLTLWACVERWRCHHEVRLQCNSQSLLKACLPVVFFVTTSYSFLPTHLTTCRQYIHSNARPCPNTSCLVTDWLTDMDWHGLTWHERVDGWWMMWWDWFDGAWIMIMEPNHGPGSWMNVMNGWWTDFEMMAVCSSAATSWVSMVAGPAGLVQLDLRHPKKAGQGLVMVLEGVIWCLK